MVVRPTSTLTYVGARLALDAALAQAHDIGGAFNIAVTDVAGGLMAFARMDGAFAMSGSIAMDKAFTVTGFGGLGSDELYDVIRAEDAVREGIGQRSRVAAFAGGLAIVVDGEFVGAVGVSGGSAAEDKRVAHAGVQAVTQAYDRTTSERGDQ